MMPDDIITIVRNETSYLDDGSDLKVFGPPKNVSGDIFGAMDALAEKAQNMLLASKKDTDYFKDGILYCGVCHQPRSYLAERNGKKWLLHKDCLCSLAEKEETERKNEIEKMALASQKLKGTFILNSRFSNCTFDKWVLVDKSVGKDSEIMFKNRLMRYVEHFPYMREHGYGLLLYGELGVGKSFGAACVVNALSKQRYSCMMTNFTSVFNAVWSTEKRQEYLDKLNQYDLLVLDDFGVEYQSDYLRSVLFEVIDSRYRSGLPLLLTTNLSVDELKANSSGLMRRVSDRILEMCHPVFVSGVNRRDSIEQKRFPMLSAILDGSLEPPAKH